MSYRFCYQKQSSYSTFLRRFNKLEKKFFIEKKYKIIDIFIDNNIDELNYYFSVIIDYYDVELIKYLIETRNVDINYDSSYCLISSIKNNDFNLMVYLINKGADINVNLGYPLRLAIKLNNIKIVKYLIEDKKVDVSNHEYILKDACRQNNYSIFKYLLDIGFPINYEDFDYLKMAIYHKNLDIIKLLIEKGLIINNYNSIVIRNLKNNDIHDIHDIQNLINIGFDIHVDEEYFFIKSCENDNFKLIKFLVEETKVNINAQNDICLIKSCENNNLNIVKYLIDKGANIYKHIEEMIKICTKRKYSQMFEFLISFAYHKNINNKHYFFNNYKFPCNNNSSSFKLFKKYNVLKKELIINADLINFS